MRDKYRSGLHTKWLLIVSHPNNMFSARKSLYLQMYKETRTSRKPAGEAKTYYSPEGQHTVIC